MTNLLTPEKTEEIRLQAFLGAAYQRVFMLRGEIGRMEADLESNPLPEADSIPDGQVTEDCRVYMETVSRRIYFSLLIGKAQSELNLIESQIKEQTT